METARALEILSRLADGFNPVSGEQYPSSSPYQQADTVRALSLAIEALRRARPVRPSRPGQGNSGKPWTKEEDAALVANFDSGMSTEKLAASHGRSGLAIEARLVKLGKLPPERMPTFVGKAGRIVEQAR